MTGEILIVGAGGIGAPCAIALAAAGVRAIAVADDDAVELTNLHRQILFRDEDVGRPKLEAFAEALRARAPGLSVRAVPERVRPANVEAVVRGAAVVVDASDNFATRFLLADACALARVPVVHAAAVRLVATVIAVAAAGRPCYRCVFEDLPEGPAPDCASAGVLGPVCGVAGALAADAALHLLSGDASVTARVVSFDGARDRLRASPVRPRPSCPLCGEVRTITSIDPAHYVAERCASGPGE